MQLSLAHGALEAEQQSVVEHRGMIDAVGIADESVSEAAEIEQAIPVGVVAGEAGDFEAEHDADMAEGDFGGEPAFASRQRLFRAAGLLEARAAGLAPLTLAESVTY